jgi:hypothetical protein
MHSRAVSCPLCSEKFFPKSLPFHLKACQKKHASMEIPCPFCDQLFPQADMPAHHKCCAARKRSVQKSTTAARMDMMTSSSRFPFSAMNAPLTPSLTVANDKKMCFVCLSCMVYLHESLSLSLSLRSLSLSPSPLHNASRKPIGGVLPSPNPSTGPSPATATGGSGGLVPCAICGRKFALDRIQTHQRICRKSKEGVFVHTLADRLKHERVNTQTAIFLHASVFTRRYQQKGCVRHQKATHAGRPSRWRFWWRI